MRESLPGGYAADHGAEIRDENLLVPLSVLLELRRLARHWEAAASRGPDIHEEVSWVAAGWADALRVALGESRLHDPQTAAVLESSLALLLQRVAPRIFAEAATDRPTRLVEAQERLLEALERHELHETLLSGLDEVQDLPVTIAPAGTASDSVPPSDGHEALHLPLELIESWTAVLEDPDPAARLSEIRDAVEALVATAIGSFRLADATGHELPLDYALAAKRTQGVDPRRARVRNPKSTLDRLLLRAHHKETLTADDIGAESTEHLAAIGRRVDGAHRAAHGDRAWSLEVLCDQDAETLDWTPIDGMFEQQALARLAEPDLRVRAGELRELLDFYWSDEFQEELLGWPDEV